VLCSKDRFLSEAYRDFTCVDCAEACTADENSRFPVFLNRITECPFASLLKGTYYSIHVSCFPLLKQSFLWISWITIANGQKTQKVNWYFNTEYHFQSHQQNQALLHTRLLCNQNGKSTVLIDCLLHNKHKHNDDLPLTKTYSNYTPLSYLPQRIEHYWAHGEIKTVFSLRRQLVLEEIFQFSYKTPHLVPFCSSQGRICRTASEGVRWVFFPLLSRGFDSNYEIL